VSSKVCPLRQPPIDFNMPHATSRPKPVRPRDAASLLIYRHTGSEIQVLMGKRRPGARFLPDVYVFPGGALDAADALGVTFAESAAQAPAGLPVDAAGAGAPGSAGRDPASRQTNLQSSPWVRAMAARDASHANALLRAALREAQEESGWRWADASPLSLGATGLRYLGRAITPAQSSRRFHARFFAVPHTRMQQDPHADGELLDLRWVDAHNPERLPIIDVTEFMLAELQSELAGKREGLPLLSYVNDMMRVRRLTL
jgi:8-oxo-dGTP pyrophosphatase MutT (NUDIX family)